MKIFQGIVLAFGVLLFMASLVTVIIFFSIQKTSIAILASTLFVVGLGLIFVAYWMNRGIQYHDDTKIVDSVLDDK